MIVFVIGVRFQSNVAWIALGLATSLTIILVLIPTENEHEEKYTETEIKDYTFIYKNLLLIFLVSSAILGGVTFFLLHCIEPIRIKPVKSFYHTN